jgi:hypothetical protein
MSGYTHRLSQRLRDSVGVRDLLLITSSGERLSRVNYSRIAQALHDIGYQGTVGLEAWASGESELALERFRAAFAT